MTVQMLLIFHGFGQKLPDVALANSKTPWRHHFHCKSKKSQNLIFALAKCQHYQNADITKKSKILFFLLSVATNQINYLNWDFFLKIFQNFIRYLRNVSWKTANVDFFLNHPAADGWLFLYLNFGDNKITKIIEWSGVQ